MSKMNLIAAIGASALMMTGAMATTAAAQPWRDHGPVYDNHHGNLTSSYVDSLEWRLHSAAQEGRIPWGQARELQRELRLVQPLAWRVETGRASQWEYRRLSNVVNRIEAVTNNYPRYSHNRRWR